MNPNNILQIALNKPLRSCFDYLCSENLRPGSRVTVPFGSQTLTGVVIQAVEQSAFDTKKLKTITQCLDTEPLINQTLLDFICWSANYYHHPIGETLFHALPKALREGRSSKDFLQTSWQLNAAGLQNLNDSAFAKRSPKQALNLQVLHDGADTLPAATLKPLREKKLIEVKAQTNNTQLKKDTLLKNPHLKLNPEQSSALNRLVTEGFQRYLLHGVTGSGKTEVYLQWCEKLLLAGKQVLILVPEIGLTPQTLKRFQQRFSCRVNCLHSGLADGERAKQWLQCQRGEARILIGTRSAIFTPLPELGGIIIDEEHDPSYKQQDGFRYSARDLAIVRAQRENIPLLLGSATPSIESLRAITQKNIEELNLRQRPGNAQIPPLKLIDLNQQLSTEGISDSLQDAITQCLNQGQQALLFINRRGFAPSHRCRDCGWIAQCHQCSTSLTQHSRPPRLHCHHCDSRSPLPKSCPECQSRQLEAIGQGTERIAEHLQKLFPETPLKRIDRDSLSRKGSMETLLQELDQGQPCLILGTQMLAKGHHFPHVTLSAIIDIDSSLFAGDFRAVERMGQLITQVRGRAGRGEQPSQVLLQTLYPDHPMIQELLHHHYDRFANQLLAQRQQAQLPPFIYLGIIRCNSPIAQHAENSLRQLHFFLQQQQDPQNCWLLGPWPSLMEKRQNRYRYELQIKSSSRKNLHQMLAHSEAFFAQQKLPRTLRWHIDVDPQDMS